MIRSCLTNRDLKSLRLTCKYLNDTVPLKFSRVFLSANPLDIQVFRAIADHPILRHQIDEIIWDDARFVSEPWSNWSELADYDQEMLTENNEHHGAPFWFVYRCRENIISMRARKISDIERPAHVSLERQLRALLPIRQCYEHYVKLKEQQDKVLKSGADKDAFVYGLSRFPKLTKVAVTPAAHGWLFCPLYETPFIRALPYGFNYPIPRGWPTAWPMSPEYPTPVSWTLDNAKKVRRLLGSPENRTAYEAYKELWRGVRSVLKSLSQCDHHVSEVRFDSDRLNVGVHHEMFTRPCEEYNHFLSLLKRPGIRRLDLTLFIDNNGLQSFLTEDFRRALAQATELTHFNLSTTLDIVSSYFGHREHNGFVSLHRIVPLDQWPRLAHFGITRLEVTPLDLLEALSKLPRAVKSIELNRLRLFGQGDADEWREGQDLERFGMFHNLMEEIKHDLKWNERDASQRPSLVMLADECHPCTTEMMDNGGHPCSDGIFYSDGYYPCEHGRVIRLDQEIHEFLYESGENPFEENLQVPKPHMGVWEDIFFPHCIRPHVGSNEENSIGVTDPEIWEGSWPNYLPDYSSEGFHSFHRMNEVELNVSCQLENNSQEGWLTCFVHLLKSIYSS
jgi:hypothetical protein